MRYVVQVYMNTRDDGENFLHGYTPGDPMATADDLRLVVEAESMMHACEAVFTVGNRMDADAEGRTWPSDVRSVSVGDVVTFPDGPSFHCKSVGWAESSFRGMRVVPLAGTRATSREGA